MVKAIGLEQGVHRVLRVRRQARVGDVLVDHLAVALVFVVCACELVIEGAGIGDPARNRCKSEEGSEQTRYVVERHELRPLRSDRSIRLFEKLQHRPHRQRMQVSLRVVLEDVWANA